MQKPRRIATPYSFAESVKVVWRNVVGLDHTNAGEALQFLPHAHRLNPIAKVDACIAFIGDIMSVGNRRLRIDKSIALFLSGCDYLVGNLEATITWRRGRQGVLFGAFQHQDFHVVDALEGLFPPVGTYLSVANNHAGDFEDQHYFRSCKLLEERGFRLFGQTEKSSVDVDGRLRLHGSTMWSNQICDRVHWLGGVGDKLDKSFTHILFPHWGYELEKYPRPAIVNLAKDYCRQFDAVLGHHPHTVQPITGVRLADKNGLIAYSLGDFCSNIPTRSYRYGMIVKLEVGPGSAGNYLVGNVHWRFLECVKQGRKDLAVRLVDRIPYVKRESDNAAQ